MSRVHYNQFKMFRSKGAVLVLFWCFVALFVVQLAMLSPDHEHGGKASEESHASLILGDNNVLSPSVVLIICMLFYPILGGLADVKFGRYKIIRWGLRSMWVVSILFCLVSVILNFVNLPHTLVKFVKPALYILICLSLGGLMSNILQFGIDQLEDASSCEIMLFLRWFAWLWYLSGVTALSLSCLCPVYESLRYLVFAALVTAATASDLLFNHWLVKESVSNNPLVTIFQVLRYAIKNKYPRERSAFTYWDDQNHSRIDLAKHKFGGPFTTEQVEDVKTFFHIIRVIFAGAFLTALFASMYPIFSNVLAHLTDKNFNLFQHDPCNRLYIENCFQRMSVRHAGDAILVVLLPLNEFIFYPIFYRVFRVSILRKASIGMVFLFSSYVACTAIEFVANHKRLQIPNATNTTCDLFSGMEDDRISLPLDYKWMTLPIVLYSSGQFFIITSTSEFLCAQSPYSMRGLLFGLAYGSTGFFAILGYGILRSIAAISRKWLSDGYGCRAWYLLMSSLLFVIILGIFFSVFKCYKKRNRDDSEDSEEIFAVNT